MRQVPRYLLIGNGRVARHFQHYFSLLSLSFTTWHRHESLNKLHEQLKDCTHILLLISDTAIEEFVTRHLLNETAVKIHFSGSVISPYVYGAHPLMTFSADLYDLNQYTQIPFIIDHDALPWDALLPGLPNQHVHLDKSLKAKYHALCVLSGNFSCMLWQKLFLSLQQEFNLPPEIAYPYLQQHTKNLHDNFVSALTGPLVRNDTDIIEHNLKSLNQDPFQEVYKSFVSCYRKLQRGDSA